MTAGANTGEPVGMPTKKPKNIVADVQSCFALAMVKMRDAEDIQQALTGAGKKIKKRMSPSSLKSRKRRMMKKRADKRVGSINNSSSSGVIKSEGGIPFVPGLKLISQVVANAHKSLKPMCVGCGF